jgi:hypothetical protein
VTMEASIGDAGARLEATRARLQRCAVEATVASCGEDGGAPHEEVRAGIARVCGMMGDQALAAWEAATDEQILAVWTEIAPVVLRAGGASCAGADAGRDRRWMAMSCPAG